MGRVREFGEVAGRGVYGLSVPVGECGCLAAALGSQESENG